MDIVFIVLKVFAIVIDIFILIIEIIKYLYK